MPKKKRKESKQGPACVNHEDRFDTEECERCHEFYCPNCYVEDWHENFLQQFVGQKRDFIQRIYCTSCQKRVVRVRLIAYIGLLLLFGTPFVLWFLLSFI
ncbi:MAG: hypothetical protein JSV04_12970 [Candidatus Heimdallarchaeota archaeon]|nr:MAG: hypothetical protein JSV04_12970 [Candidatus Heimdallarchaeota archaeon]